MRPSLWFVTPVHNRLQLAAICLRQLRRTCDALQAEGIDATAVVIGDARNLRHLRQLDALGGFGTVERDNDFVTRKFNDGIQVACERPLPPSPREPTHGQYLVIGRREYRGHKPGATFEARLDRNAEQRAITRRDIRLLGRFAPSLRPGSWTLPDGWDPARPADYVVPIGSDDWVDHRIFLDLPRPDTLVGFQHISFVREDGLELTETMLVNPGGCGIRIYPNRLMAKLGYRPADEDRERACDTSILTNLQVAHEHRMRLVHVDTDARQIVDWKSEDEQLNGYEQVRRRHRKEQILDDPFTALADIYPAEALEEMRAHYDGRELTFPDGWLPSQTNPTTRGAARRLTR